MAILQKQGTVIVKQNADGVETTEDLIAEKKGLKYTIFPDKNREAHGHVYLADGKFVNEGDGNVENHQLWKVDYLFKTIIFDDELEDSIKFDRVNGNNIIEEIKVVGIQQEGLDKNFVCAQTHQGADVALKGTYDHAKKTFVITKADEAEDIEIQNMQEINFGIEGEDFNPCKPAYNTGTITEEGNAINFTLTPSDTNKPVGEVLKPLSGKAEVVDDKVIRIKIWQEGEKNYEAPLEGGHLGGDTGSVTIGDIVKISTEGSPFEITLQNGNDQIIKIDNFTFTKQYIRLEE